MQQVDGVTILLLNRRDKGSFETIFRTYYARLCDVARRYTGDVAEAQDIVTDIFSNLWQLPKTFESVQQLEAYLHVGVRNKSINYLRRQRKIRTKNEEIAYLSRKEEDFFSRKYIDSYMGEQLRKAIEQLPEEIGKVLMMEYFEEMGRQEIADTLNIDVKTVFNRSVRGKAILQERLLQQKNFALLLFFNLLDIFS